MSLPADFCIIGAVAVGVMTPMALIASVALALQ
jgi:hypothetical protein